MKDTTQFAKYGLLIGIALIISEYLLFTFMYSKIIPNAEDLHYKYDSYVLFFLLSAIYFIIHFNNQLKKEVVNHYSSFPNIPINTGFVIGFAIFNYGAYIVYSVMEGKRLESQELSIFVFNNLDVMYASDPYSIVAGVLFPVYFTFLYQGFLQNGLAKFVGFRLANVLTSFFYGYWLLDPVGGTLFNLLLNDLYRKSRNILYPLLARIIVSLFFIMGHLVKPDIWILKAYYPDYNEELIKGYIIMAIGVPIVFPGLLRIFSNRSVLSQ